MKITASFFCSRWLFVALLYLCPLASHAGIEDGDELVDLSSSNTTDCEKLVEGIEIDLTDIALDPDQAIYLAERLQGAKICGSGLQAGGLVCVSVGGISLVCSVLAAGTGLLLIALREPIGVGLNVSMPMFFGGLFGAVPLSFITIALGSCAYNWGTNVKENGMCRKQLSTLPCNQ